MLKHYLSTALRQLGRQKLFGAINVFSLAIGLAFCLLVLLFVRDELSYDQFHTNADRIHRLYRDVVEPSSPFDRELSMPIPAGPAMQATFPEVEAFVRLDFPNAALTVRHGETMVEQDGILAADPAFFDVFSFPLLSGRPETALAGPYSVVLTESVARRYFGEADALGQRIELRLGEGYVDLLVTGVAAPPPTGSSVQFEVLIPYDLFVRRLGAMQRAVDSWGATRSITYVMLREGADAANVQTQMPQFMETHLGSIFDQMRANGVLTTDGPPAVYRLQPMTDIHLNPEVPPGITPPSDPRYAYILGAIALAVLLIACINFTLLALGRSTRRAKEVGVRKAMGAQPRQLAAQFWGEAVLLSALALGIGIGLAALFLPVFNELAGKTLHFGAVEGLWAGGALLVLLAMTSLIAGGYPALVLARLQPVASLRNRAQVGGRSLLANGLVTAQFTLSVFLIVSTLVMAQQLRHLRTHNLGYQGEQVVVIPTRGLDSDTVLDRYRSLAEAEPTIDRVSGSNFAFGRGLWRRGFRYEGELKQVVSLRIADNYLETLRMDLIQGRDLDPQRASDSTSSILVNEALARDFGWDNPVGRQLPVEWGGLQNPTIVGVVRDFHFEALQAEVAPAVLYTTSSDPVLNVLVRIQPDAIPATLDQLRATWASLTHDVPFQYSFLDADMDQLYQSEERWSQIIGYGALFAVLIAGLGLFGVATLAAARRTKEVGIRKVLGASAAQLVLLLSKDFVVLVGIAIAIAAPVGYLAMRQWLDSFAARIDLGPRVFLLAGALALLVALATVSIQALRTATTDPVKALRYE